MVLVYVTLSGIMAMGAAIEQGGFVFYKAFAEHVAYGMAKGTLWLRHVEL